MDDQLGDLSSGEESGAARRAAGRGDGLLTAPHVLGVIAGFAMQHVRRLSRSSHITSGLMLLAAAVGAVFGPDEVWFRGLLVTVAVLAVVFWLVTQAQLWVARKAIHKVATPVQVIKPAEAADALAGALGLPGLTPWPLVKMVIRWVRNPEQRQTELAAVTERLHHVSRNPSEVAMLFTAVPE